MKRDDVDLRTAAMLALVTILVCACLAFLLVRGEEHPARPGGWEHDERGLSWTCTSDGHQVIRDDASGSLLAGDDTRCDSAG